MSISAKLIVSTMLLLGCTTLRKDPKDFLDAPLAGVVNGSDWQYKFAYTDPTVATPDEDDMLFIFLPFEPKKPCAKELEPKKGELDEPRRVSLAAPLKQKLLKMRGKGTHHLIFEYMSPEGKQLAVNIKKGKLQLTRITDTEIEGKLYARASDKNWISGTFKAVACNSLDLR